MVEKSAPQVASGATSQLPPDYCEVLAWLYGTQRFGIKLGLDSIRRILDQLKLPGRDQRIVHAAGTNGKGSVCAMIAAISRAQGYRTGLFSSPHLVSFRERIQVDGEMIRHSQVVRGLGLIRDLIRDWEPHPTFFEITTALGLLHFKECACDIVVLETGLGGRLDATNATTPIVSVITPIDFDHQKWLGDSLALIAAEKAGIIKRNVPVVSAAQSFEAEMVIRARATECEAPFEIVKEPWTKNRIALAGAHQKRNAALAVAALRVAGVEIGESAVALGLGSVEWPARFQRWDDRTVIDGAHNPAGAHILAQTWREQFGELQATIMLAVLADKDLPGICGALMPIAKRFILPPIRSQRAQSPEHLAQVIASISSNIKCSLATTLSDALAMAEAEPDPILIAGSLHFAGEALATLGGNPADFEECAQ